MRVTYSPLHLRHDPPVEVSTGIPIPTYEVAGRAEAIRGALAADPTFALEEPGEHGVDPILAVHDPGLLRYLETAWAEWQQAGETAPAIIPDSFNLPALRGSMGPAPEPAAPGGRIGWWCFDTATPIVAGTYAAARAAVDVALDAAAATRDGERIAYGLCRPPGHHAARAMFGGYCYLNNAAIAAEWLVRNGGGRVGILDLDYHHGNGTQAIFWERPDVPYTSIHADPRRMYPYFTGYANETGGGAGSGATFNQPMPAGLDDAGYLVALGRALDWLDGRTDGILVVSLGMDTYGHDPICDFALSTPVYAQVGRRVAATGNRLVVLQEGGYFLPALGENVRTWLRGAAGLPLDLVPGTAGDPAVG